MLLKDLVEWSSIHRSPIENHGMAAITKTMKFTLSPFHSAVNVITALCVIATIGCLVALWKAKLPAAGYATPATYSVNGRQYVVIACGGGKIGTRSLVHAGRLEAVDVLVTDDGIDERAARAIARETGDAALESDAENGLGTLDHLLGRLDDARDHFEAGLLRARDAGDRDK